MAPVGPKVMGLLQVPPTSQHVTPIPLSSKPEKPKISVTKKPRGQISSLVIDVLEPEFPNRGLLISPGNLEDILNTVEGGGVS